MSFFKDLVGKIQPENTKVLLAILACNIYVMIFYFIDHNTVLAMFTSWSVALMGVLGAFFIGLNLDEGFMSEKLVLVHICANFILILQAAVVLVFILILQPNFSDAKGSIDLFDLIDLQYLFYVSNAFMCFCLFKKSKN